MSCFRSSSALQSDSFGLCSMLPSFLRGSISRVQASIPDCRETLWRTQQASRMAELLSGEYWKEEDDNAQHSTQPVPLLFVVRKKGNPYTATAVTPGVSIYSCCTFQLLLSVLEQNEKPSVELFFFPSSCTLLGR